MSPGTRSVCVFCGSAAGTDAEFIALGTSVGRALAARSIRLVYGGTGLGVMKAVADAALQGGSTVTGIIPATMVLQDPISPRIDDLRIVQTLSVRKAIMIEESDGFLVLPGGFGTMDEFFEAVVYRQTGLHQKPIGLVNFGDFYGPLLAWMQRAVAMQFVSRRMADTIDVLPDLAALEVWLDRALIHHSEGQ